MVVEFEKLKLVELIEGDIEGVKRELELYAVKFPVHLYGAASKQFGNALRYPHPTLFVDEHILESQK